MDEQIGRLRAKLRELGIERETLVLFCSDNGPADPLAKKDIASAGPFKGHKHQMYEGGVLVPACAEWPGVIDEGIVTEVRCSTVDFMPTIARLVGEKKSLEKKVPIDGIDLMTVIDGSATERDQPLFFGYRRLVSGIDGQSIISGNYKLLREAKKNGRLRLYDLESDPYEKKDLASALPERTAELAEAMAEIDASCQRSRDGADYRY